MHKKLNSNHLKIIAIIAMTLDHFCDLFYPGFPFNPVAIGLHSIGRLTAPIMWFFICEGYHYTHNVKKYMLRLFSFAVVSHFSYCFAFGIDPVPLRSGIFNQTSVMYPLFVAVLVLWIGEQQMHERLQKILCFLLTLSAFPADWSCIAVLAIVAMYQHRGNFKKQMRSMVVWVIPYGLVAYFFVNKLYAILLIFVLLVIPLLKEYNGERGKATWMKWFFYIYYPIHLVILGILRLAFYGNVSLIF